MTQGFELVLGLPHDRRAPVIRYADLTLTPRNTKCGEEMLS